MFGNGCSVRRNGCVVNDTKFREAHMAAESWPDAVRLALQAIVRVAGPSRSWPQAPANDLPRDDANRNPGRPEKSRVP